MGSVGRGLTKERIVSQAIALIEREGEDALTMRRLGSRLGVQAMSLYHHVGGRDELLDAISAKTFESVTEVELGDDWREALMRFGAALRDVAVAQPRTFRLVGLQPLDAPLAVAERVLAVLVAAGFEPADALAIYRAVASYARGYGLGEAHGFTVDAAGAEQRAALRSLPRAEFPILAGRVRDLAKLDADRGFELGLRALIGGVASATELQHA
jgi:AcrR family transcriptional regulator